MTPRPIFVARLNFNDPPREAEFSKWYNKKHVPEMCGLKGVLNGQRYEILRGRKTNTKYMAIYELEDESCVDYVLLSPEALAVGGDTQKTWGYAVSDLAIAVYKPIIP